MSATATQVAAVLVLLVVSGVLSMSELAVVTARKARLEHRAEEGNRGAAAALDLAARPDAFLAPMRMGITLVAVLAGALGGMGIARALAARLAEFPRLAPYAGPLSLGVVVVVITFLALVIGDLVPRRVVLGDPERVAARVARPMRLVARIGAPFASLLTGSTNAVFRLLGVPASREPRMTEQDIRAMVEQGAESGAVGAAEHEIVENAFRLGDRQVEGIMTPRPDVRWLDAAAPAELLRAELAEQLADARGSRLLVCQESVEQVLGVVHAEDLLARSLAGQPLDRDGLLAVLQPPLFVPGTMPAFALLRTFRETRQDMAVALDEFGGVQGVVMIDDIVEAVMGDLPERGEPDVPEIVREADGAWLADGDAPIDDLELALDLTPTGSEERRDYHTLGGLVLTRLGRVPRAGDAFDYGAHHFEVVAMEGRRVGSVRVTRMGEASGRS